MGAWCPRAVGATVAAWSFALAVPAWGAPSSPSSSRARAAMLPLRVDGPLPEGWADKLSQGIASGLVQGGVEVVASAKVIEVTGGAGDCTNETCFKFVSSSVDARFLVRAQIEIEERNYEVAIDIIDGQLGTIAASSSESCQLCGLAEVEELVTKQAAVLRQKVDLLALQPAAIALTSVPAGALILVDGVEVGTAPLEHEIPPGAHTIVARKPGYVEQSREIDALQGVTEKIVFDLLPEGGTEAPRASSARVDWRVPTGWSLVGLGTAALAAGVTFLVLDERPYEADCSGADVDALGNCRHLYDTVVHGAALTGGGGVFVVSGAAMLISARLRRSKPTSRKAARAAAALLRGRF